MSRSAYHHGDLRAGLIEAAATTVEQGGPDAVSLRALAQTLGVSTAAPYRHFADRRALLDAVAARGFEDLTAAYHRAVAEAPDAASAARGMARAYLALAFGKPGLFRLMFASDLVNDGASPALLTAARAGWEALRGAVAAADPHASPAVVARRTLTGWSTLHGFISLVQGGRLKGFMTEPLGESELLEAVIDKALGGP
ncbi:MAG: TetR/AcrR family transcriptional regulator [Phenylobacterium sp.]|nr:MAG: TetR/AcrR family transcriptional regulator [Phenylobacterium sp.]